MRGLERFCSYACILPFAATAVLGGEAYIWTTLAGGSGSYPLGGNGDGTNTSAHFDTPDGVVVDVAGCVYVADTGGNTVRRIAPIAVDWVVTTIAGSPRKAGFADGTNGSALFNLPIGIAVDGAGILYVADGYNGAVRRVTPTGTNWVTSVIGRYNLFIAPYAVAVDGATNIYVAEYNGGRIRMASPSGTNWVIGTVAGSTSLGSADGTNTDARFNSPAGLALDPSGSLYVADSHNYTIRKATPVGTNWVVTTIAGLAGVSGSVDGTNSDARFGFPVGVAVDRAGNVYVGDYLNHTIRQLRPVGTNWQVTTIGGLAGASGFRNGAGTNARFFRPAGISTDGAGNLYVADEENDAIRFGQLAFSVDAALSGDKLVLSWPLCASNYLLEAASELGSGSAWVTVSNVICTSGANFVLTNSTDKPAAFYRLRRQ